ncbi:MAG: hypothetical protein WCA15_11100 [Candidatus Acidiferrales bacterium]
MRMSIGVPGVALYFEHDQVKPLIKGQAVKLKTTIEKTVVPSVLKATCKVLEVVANNTADAHDYLIRRAS